MIAVALVGLLIDHKVLQAREAFMDQLQAQARLLGDQKEQLEVQTENLADQAVEQEMLNDPLLQTDERLEEAIGGYVQLLLMGLRGPLNEAQESDLRRIEINQEHVLRLINEMLELAKLEVGQMPCTSVSSSCARSWSRRAR